MLSLSPTRLLAMLVCAVVLLAGADGCSSDPDVEGAKLYLRQDDYASALENLERALATNPENAEALALKGRVLYLQAKEETDPTARRPMLEEMASALDRAEALDPANDEVGQVRLAAWADEVNAGTRMIQSSGGDAAQLEQAIAALSNAVYIQPDSAGGHFNLGLAYLASGDAEAAIGPFERAKEAGAADAGAYRYLGMAYLATDQGTRAVEVLEEGMERHPDEEAIRAELLNAYAATGQTDRAVSAYEEMLAGDPDNALLRYNYGSTLLQLERYDDAVEQLQHAVRLSPDNANAHYNLGAAYQNKAAAVNAQMREEDDTARADALRGERDALLEEALPHLEEARSMTSGDEEQDICRALFQVYAQLNRMDDAQEASECAGMDMN